MTPVEIALVSVIAYMTGVFSGILGGIRLRKSMLRSLSREHLSSDAPPVSVPGPVQAPVPLVQASAPPSDTKQQEIVIRTID